MRIEQSQVALASRRVASVFDMTRSTMETWIGDRPAKTGSTVPSASGAQATARAAIASLSAQALASARSAAQPILARSASPAKAAATLGAPDPTDPLTTDPSLSVLIMLIERLTGRKVRLVHLGNTRTDAQATTQGAGESTTTAAAAAQAQNANAQPQKAGWGVEVHIEQIHQETETTDFTATGQVVTADGRSISFDFGLAMHRELTQTSTTDIQAGDAVKKVDPIAINLSGGSVALSSTRSAFDLNSDGTAEQVALPAAGTYFLALDRNGNGNIDNGGELFGPTTGHGFTELKSLDGDGNGWIDEADAAYASLKLWAGPDGGQMSLADAGVGALYVGRSASTQFDLRSDSNETLGQIVSSSIYLGESGQPGAVQQVDLTA
jgi:hypothetical protein